MINPAVFIREPLTFKNAFKVYPPSIKEVVTKPNFSMLQKILTLSQEDICDDLKKKNPEVNTFPTPFEFLLINAYHDASFRKLAEEAFQLFLHQEITFLFEEKMIIIGKLEDVVQQIQSVEEIITIKEEDYFDFQNTIRMVCGNEPEKAKEQPNPNEDPRIAEIKRKARERDRIKARQKNKNGISLQTCLTAICCMGIGITPLNIGEMSYASISPIMSMMQEKEKYDIDIRSLLAGADSKKVKPKYWIRNSEKE